MKENNALEKVRRPRRIFRYTYSNFTFDPIKSPKCKKKLKEQIRDYKKSGNDQKFTKYKKPCKK